MTPLFLLMSWVTKERRGKTGYLPVRGLAFPDFRYRLCYQSLEKHPNIGIGKTSNSEERENRMSEIVHTSRSKIVRKDGPTRKAVIEGFPGEVHYGVHGGIKNFYKIEPKEEHPATLDHMVSAIAA